MLRSPRIGESSGQLAARGDTESGNEREFGRGGDAGAGATERAIPFASVVLSVLAWTRRHEQPAAGQGIAMSQAPSAFETSQGYAPPVVTQFSVFLTNKVGKLFDLVKAFDGLNSQICALAVHDATDHAVVRIITNNAGIARRVLKEQNLPYSEKDVLVVELSKGHTLTSLCVSLLGAELSIQFAYPLMLRPNGTPTIAISVDDVTLAGQILRRKEFRIFGEGDLPSRPNEHDH